VSAACVEQTFYACEWLNDTAELRQFSKPVSSVLEFATFSESWLRAH
jgi:hypothetical protein